MVAPPPVSTVIKNDGTGVEIIDSKLMITDIGYINQIRRNCMTNCTAVQIQGQNLSVGTSYEEISDLGTQGFGNWPSTGDHVTLISDKSEDNPSGDGARKAVARGLSDDFVEIEEEIPLNGTSPSAATLKKFYRIHEIEVTEVGPGLTNVGTITVRIGSTDIISINPFKSKSQSGRYTVPVNTTLYLEQPESSGINGKNITFGIYTRDALKDNAPFVLIKSWSVKDNSFVSMCKLPPIQECHDIIMLAKCEIAAGGIVSAYVNGWYENNV